MNKINRVLFIGSKQLGLRILNELYLLSPNKLIGVITLNDFRDTRSVFAKFKDFSRQTEIDIHVVESQRASEAQIQALRPDLCIVVGWYWLFSDALLDTVPFGFVGLHNSLLPQYRGGSPLVWAIINNEKEVGCSYFSLSREMDAGDIWAQESVSVDINENISDLLEKLEDRSVNALHECYPRLLDGTMTPVTQDHALATYCAQRRPSDGNIDWNKTALEVHNFIRAQSAPYPGAFTYYKDHKLTVWKARCFHRPYYGIPGQVVHISKSGVSIICGDHQAIILEWVETSGHRAHANQIIQTLKVRMSDVVTNDA
ncbi:MAG: hypothetical protein COB51_08135 [Moraxellaceae bacterium]|nr:MAG: hypothetical protein COB51_08135 [Moraxellaceae bacterium]